MLRQLYMLPHWDRSCRSNFPSHPVTVYWHRDNQPQHWLYNTAQGSHLSAKFLVTGTTRPRKIPAQAGFEPQMLPLSRRTPWPLGRQNGSGRRWTYFILPWSSKGRIRNEWGQHWGWCASLRTIQVMEHSSHSNCPTAARLPKFCLQFFQQKQRLFVISKLTWFFWSAKTRSLKSHYFSICLSDVKQQESMFCINQ